MAGRLIWKIDSVLSSAASLVDELVRGVFLSIGVNASKAPNFRRKQ